MFNACLQKHAFARGVVAGFLEKPATTETVPLNLIEVILAQGSGSEVGVIGAAECGVSWYCPGAWRFLHIFVRSKLDGTHTLVWF
jgi:hypothetical protein